ncbi:MAG: hypothetical protein A3C85_04605 [Candidatus Doudnabacteria bacterium RIFCSPHIGHO2_02_FULL_48_21]|uniref:MBL fold hydrolase n=1 Tax=Candidatus Doudnabacteria bacterium RIFCSPLOWO2_02_FULL_48_13 TaxID=1817845 RepID=A0A1F5QCI2_9BACT|nr:MAG: hypothetical protein A3K05_00460 [Candidatus Doudnabacteria bacterium RIFCSPHIGHO2_01_48_18]OGE79694.1 MAG: hypothetical protein A2668_01190 [Candidatus Doudnabacteria bacterium RIFCSPHIGHO2_01_FULL_48_180]OGE91495.1 MAG: hypothetical protein A3F44_01390 [Candidatus Doudnabacteria bacterium RIFCSPHIGHO2_12_FULL_47_25]OGE93109.1 MAG: hypothetical protein A3C85_04605 [Candidatus Doudnabacteria bacterium RIFCSPHIGHO2_02_FULL_48_21]OGE98116.1 MAG: hypothetical protein A3A83_02565 [Candidatu
MPSITFYGGANEVTGSSFLVKGKKITVLVDCGLFQGEKFAHQKNYDPMPFACGEIDHVLVTHAHLDHTGRIPKICLEGFAGNIFATKPTQALMRYLWEDAIEIMEIEQKETGRPLLYTKQDASRAEQFFTAVNYGEKIMLSEDDYAIFHNAGHILGSAFIELVIDGKRLVFSGDIGNVKPALVKETEKLPANIDLLVCESTYGNRVHETGAQRKKIFTTEIKQVIKNKGTVVVPAFAVERTQEILHLLHELNEQGQIPAIPIFLDSPLAIKVTKVFKKFRDFFNDLHTDKPSHDLFNFPGLRLAETRDKSKQINHVQPPKMIIAGSGMMNGGRVLYHLEHYLSDPRSTVLVIGYQAAGTLGRRIVDGKKWIPLFNKSVRVRAKIKAIGGFSAHADQQKLTSWIKTAKHLRQICLVHGDAENIRQFANALSADKIPTVIPEYRETINV